MFAYSSNIISISKLVIKHADGIAFTAVGVYATFQLLESTLDHNKVNCLIITKDNSNDVCRNSNICDGITQQKHEIIDSVFLHGNTKYTDSLTDTVSNLASGITVLFGHVTNSFELIISNVTFFENRGYGSGAFAWFNSVTSGKVKETNITIVIHQLLTFRNSFEVTSIYILLQ